MKLYRQGDVLLIESGEKCPGLGTKHAELTVQLGEATGHHHTLYSTNKEPGSYVREWKIGDKRFVELDTEWLLKHQEHECLKINPGVYEIVIEKEYDPFDEAMKKVVD